MAMGLKEKVVLLLVNGRSAEMAEKLCLNEGLTAEQARETVEAARMQLASAASIVRDEQFGTAVMRLNDLYARAVARDDIKTALQAQRELSRHLDLYKDQGPDSDEAGKSEGVASELRRQLDLVAGHLVPLGLVDEWYPVEEHARVAAQKLIESGLCQETG